MCVHRLAFERFIKIHQWLVRYFANRQNINTHTNSVKNISVVPFSRGDSQWYLSTIKVYFNFIFLYFCLFSQDVCWLPVIMKEKSLPRKLLLSESGKMYNFKSNCKWTETNYRYIKNKSITQQTKAAYDLWPGATYAVN